jgi:pyruvate/2-oxoglutarate dehydrogenase complex dihydrolipoamide dehydrogenase (E3) component
MTIEAYRNLHMPLSQPRGFMNASIGSDDRLVGFTAFGAEASDLMAVAQTAMLGGMPYTALRSAIFTHPTVAEGLVVLFASPPTTPTAKLPAET